MTQVEALAFPGALPGTGCQARYRRPDAGVVAPPWAGADFGRSYREAQAIWPHIQPIVVPNLNDDLIRCGIVDSCFESIS